MRIEVATAPNTPNKEKGDLLERVAGQVLKTQSYVVTEQVRVTGSELDLLCKHQVNNRKLYVECKAHRDTLSANILTNLLGTVTFRNYDEGWLITTGPLGKDAKGFKDEWEEKPTQERSKLSIYTSERVVELLINSSFILPAPTQAPCAMGEADSIGEWTLLITTAGVFWAVTHLCSGVPTGLYVYDAKNGQAITDTALLRTLKTTDTSLNTLDFEFVNKVISEGSSASGDTVANVVQVQAGEDWADYRPARPEHFVGRKSAQDRLMQLFRSITGQKTRTRVLAITGDSGMGKSSIIAKLRDRCRNVRHRNRFFCSPLMSGLQPARDIYRSITPCFHASRQN